MLRPTVLLLDEPLAGLDHQMAQQTLTLLRSTQRRLGLTTVLVTHDQEIALSSADRLVVMNQGRILQSGPPREVFEQPSDAFVAQFLGRAAFLPVEVLDTLPDGRALVTIFGREQSLPAHPDVVPGPGVAVIRPHALTVSATDQRSGPWAEATGELALIQEVRYYGDHVEYALETEHGSALATGDLDAAIEPQRTVRLRLDRAHTWVLPRAGRA